MKKVLFLSIAVVIGSVAALYAAWGGDAESQTELIQAAGSGSLSDNGDGSFTLTLREASAITWFSDRPERSYGRLSPQDFVSLWQSDDVQHDPPNAALSVDDRTYAMELAAISFDDAASTFTYRVLPLDDSEAGRIVDPAELAELEFGPVALFIDALPTPLNGQVTD